MRHDRLPAVLRLGNPDTACALFVAEDTATERLRRVVQTSFALTEAETNITLSLASGLPLKEAAQYLGISINTARNQLQSVFDKSGVKRQSDLILVVTQMSVILAATVGNEPSLHRAEVQDDDYPSYKFTITEDGRRLAYRTYGNGTRPVVFFHEAVGSSRLLPGTDAWARERDLTIYSVDRPGCGFSDPMPNYSMAAVADDTLRLLDTLGVTEATYLGWLSGASHALATAIRAPSRVRRVICVSGRLPTATDHSQLTAIAKLRSNLGRQPWMLGSFFNILRSRSSDTLHRRLLRRVYGAAPADAALLESRPLLLEHLTAATQESLAITSTGVVDEIRTFAKDHDLALDAIQAPIELWHGDQDPLAPQDAIASALGDQVTEHHRFENAGALILFERWLEILDSAAERHNLP